MPILKIPNQLRSLATADSFDLAGKSVSELLAALREAAPLVAQEIVTGDGRAAEFVAVFVDGRRLRQAELTQDIHPDARVTLVVAAAGG